MNQEKAEIQNASDKSENPSTSSGQNSKILETLTTAISETAEIEVTTYIDLDLDRLEHSPSSKRIHTAIDLFNQTINHEIDLKLIDNPAYGELKRWHIEQVHRRQDSMIENLAKLSKMRRVFLNQKSDT